MKKILIVLFCISFLFGCFPRNFKSHVSGALQPASLRSSFNTQPVNYKTLSKCGNTDVSVNIINIEKRNFDVSLARGWYLNSQDVTSMTVEYLKEAYRQCRVLLKTDSPKTITISFQKIEGWISFNSGATLQIDVGIPEKNTIIPFTITQSNIELYYAVASSIHDITWQIINDPVIQDYITCR